MQGVIKKLTDRNYGFISVEGGDDVFFHSAELQGVTFNELREGDAVTFEMGQGPKGPNAVQVKRA